MKVLLTINNKREIKDIEKITLKDLEKKAIFFLKLY